MDPITNQFAPALTPESDMAPTAPLSNFTFLRSPLSSGIPNLASAHSPPLNAQNGSPITITAFSKEGSDQAISLDTKAVMLSAAGGSTPEISEVMAEFTLFPKLPFELRSQIWDASMEEGRVIEVQAGPLKCFYYAENAVPVQFRVCSESRARAMKQYEILKVQTHTPDMHEEFKNRPESEAMPRFGNWKFPRSPFAAQPDPEDCAYFPPFFTYINYSRDILYMPMERLESSLVANFEEHWVYVFLAYLALSDAGTQVQNIALNSSILSYRRSSSSLGRECCALIDLHRIYIVWEEGYGSTPQDMSQARKKPLNLTKYDSSEAKVVTKAFGREVLKGILLWICACSAIAGFNDEELRSICFMRFSKGAKVRSMQLLREE